MADMDLIREIVETYDFTPWTREKIIRIATRRVQEQGIASSNGIYTYVDRLIEKFQKYRKHSATTIDLDAPRGEQSGTDLHNVVGFEDPNLKSLFEPEMFEPIEVLRLFRNQFSDVDFQILEYLSGQTSSLFRITPEEFTKLREQLLPRLPQIRQRLETLTARYIRNGKIVVPNRPIVSVQFEPEFSVRYGPRRYNGNPLAIYREDPSVQGLSRGQLKIADQSLYVKLRQTGQISGAIPEVLNRLPQSAVAKIIEAHEKYKGNAKKSSRNLGYSFLTVLKYWHEAGLQAQGKRDPTLEGEVVLPILDAHVTYHGNASEAARNLGTTPYMVLRYWRDAGLPILGKDVPLPKKSKPNKAEVIVSAYERYHGNADEAAKDLPYSARTIARQWRDSGLEVVIAKPKLIGITKVAELSPDETQKIIEAHKTYGGRATRASKALHHTIDTVLKYWKSAGIRIRGQGDSSLSDEEVQQIITAHRTYNGNAKKATEHLPYSSSTIRGYWREAKLRVALRGEHNALPQDKVNEILTAHSLYGGNSLEASRQLGRSDITIRKYWIKEGLIPPPNSR